MPDRVAITTSLLDTLADSISAKSGEPTPLTLAQMTSAVDGISTSGVDTSHDTVDAAHLLLGYTAHDSSGDAITGEYVAPSPTLQSKSKSYTPSETAQSETVSADVGYDGLSSVDVSVGAISSTYVGTGITRRDSTDLGASGATVTAPAGYYANAATKTIGSGSATPAATISGTSASVSTGTNTLTLSKTVSNTPQVSAGYVSSGTAGNSTVSLTASVTTKGATTYHPSTSDQSIASDTYTTGAQTIKAVTLANLTAENIKSGVTVKVGDSTDDDCVASVTGTYSGGGTDHLTKLATKSLGTISTSSTSAADTGQTLDVTGFDEYDMLIAVAHTSPHTNGRHVATVRLINFSATSNVNTKTATSIATSTQHYKLSSSGTLSERSGTTPYGVYVNAATISTGTPRKCTLTIYQRYNSTSTGTINGNYVLDVYGVKLQDLF